VGKVALDGIALAGLAAPPPPALAGSELAEWEEAELGVDHAYAGAIVAEAWRLPDAIVEGIARHHERVDDPLPSAICLADFIAHCAATDDHDRSVLQSEAESASQILGLQASDVDTLIERTREQVTALAVVTHGSS